MKLLGGDLEQLPFGLNSIVERMMAQLFINSAKSVIGFPDKHHLGGRTHQHSRVSWWCRLANSPLPQLPLRDDPAPLILSSTTPLVKHIRLYSAQGNFYDVELQACMASTMIRHFARRHCDSSLPLPTISAETLEQIIIYLRHYAHQTPPEIELPIVGEFLGSHGALNWDIQFVHMNWTCLFDLLLAANLLGIDPLVDLICAKIAIAIKYPGAGGNYPFDHRGALMWPEVIQELARVFEASTNQERDLGTRITEPKNGDLVRIQNLTGKHAERLNGQLAEVVGSFPRSHRFGVSILHSMTKQGGEQVSIKKCNLLVIHMTPKHLINRSMSWYVGWFMEVPFYH